MLLKSLKTSLIDEKIISDENLQHKLLINKKGSKIITSLNTYLQNCFEFKFSVAFITKSGVIMLKEVLAELERKNIKGKILTGDYLTFTEPAALDELNAFTNIEVRILTSKNLHTKGFFFRENENWNIIIGSSNLTQNALTKTQEWNIKLSAKKEGKIVNDVLSEFDLLWNESKKYENYSKEYYALYKAEHQRKLLINDILDLPEFKNKISVIKPKEILPNAMQSQALYNLSDLRQHKKRKALIISATGTGKTYLVAFDVRNYKPQKMLFIVHRENIAKKAKETFENIISHKTFGLYTGNDKDIDADYIFCTIQTLYKNLNQFSKNQFDYIVVDEVHHSGAPTYQKVLDYFTPSFLLGMTATPQRSDNFNILELFDYNIAYELRLHKAYDWDLLAPFHYFGITDIQLDQKLLDNIEKDEKLNEIDINKLTSDERVKHIIQKTKYYGHSGDFVKGLMFVSNQDEAYKLSQKLNLKGLKTQALTGNESEKVRNEAIQNLEDGNLEYLISVNIFNEGLDIPCINQVVLLRPTQSAIVYVQQLGRGLRKDKNKEYVVLIDFIGNYKNNFLIPTALSEDSRYDKDYLKVFLNNGTDLFPGTCTINFDKISQEMIYKNINNSNLGNWKRISTEYDKLKQKLNRKPWLMDFYTNNFMSPEVILKNKDTYYDVLKKKEENLPQLTKKEYLALKFISQEFTPIKRIHEMLILKFLLDNLKGLSKKEIIAKIDSFLNCKYSQESIENALLHLELKIFSNSGKRSIYEPIIKYENDYYYFNINTKNSFFLLCLEDLITFNLTICKENNIIDDLILYKKYSRKDVNLLLNLDYIKGGINVGGYIFVKSKNIVLIYITLDDTNSFTVHDNEILNNSELTWFSKSGKVLSKNGKLTDEGKIKTGFYTPKIFIKKTRNEDFYYIGDVTKTLDVWEEKKDNKNIIKYLFKLEFPLNDTLLKYLRGK